MRIPELVIFQSSVFTNKRNKPIKDGTIMLIKKSESEAFNAVLEVSPIWVKINIDAPSRTPSSLNEMGDKIVLANIITTAAHRNLTNSIWWANEANNITNCKR